MDTGESIHQQFGDSSLSSSDPPASGSSKDPDDSNKPMDS